MGRLWILSVSWGLRSRPAQRFLTFRRSLGFRSQGSRSTIRKVPDHDRKPNSSTVTKVLGQGPAQRRESFNIYKIVGPSLVRWLKLRPMSLVSCLSVRALRWRSRQMCSTKKKKTKCLRSFDTCTCRRSAPLQRFLVLQMPQKLAADIWKVVDDAQVWSGRFGHIHGPGPCPNSPCLCGISTKPLETHDSCKAILVDKQRDRETIDCCKGQFQWRDRCPKSP